MRTELKLLAAGMFLAATSSALAGTAHYVDVNNASPTPPYTNWATAAVTIQDAVDAAVSGDEIVVTNGTYATGGRAVAGTITNRVAVGIALTVRSVNGPDVTVINGSGAVRCVWLTNDTALMGFTLTNGSVTGNGRGVYCESASAVLSNCVLSGNSATGYLATGGGAEGGTLNNCTVVSNSVVTSGPYANGEGGGAAGCTLNNCTLSGNSANDGFGGGAGGCTLNNCTLTGNVAAAGGGARGCTLNNCTLASNSAIGGGGGAYQSTLNNCTLSGNSVFVGDGGGAYSSTLNNCTLTGNSASFGGGAADSTINNCGLTGNSAGNGGGAEGGTLNNCIVYFNTASSGANYSGSTLNYCCTTPDPGGAGNITNAPLFVDQAGGNLRLQMDSPCINAGNNSYVIGTTDLDGNPRIVSGTVDMGAYEYQSPASVISYSWLQQYGLPIDGSADYTDADHDGMNNWQEWRCGTCPTNSLSVLKMLSVSNAVSGVKVSWQSVAGVNYLLECSTNLSATPPFTLLATNVPGQAGTTTYMDTNAVGAGPFFYRVRVGN